MLVAVVCANKALGLTDSILEFMLQQSSSTQIQYPLHIVNEPRSKGMCNKILSFICTSSTYSQSAK